MLQVGISAYSIWATYENKFKITYWQVISYFFFLNSFLKCFLQYMLVLKKCPKLFHYLYDFLDKTLRLQSQYSISCFLLIWELVKHFSVVILYLEIMNSKTGVDFTDWKTWWVIWMVLVIFLDLQSVSSLSTVILWVDMVC